MLLALALASQAVDPERWTCIQDAYDGGTPVVLEFSLTGDFLLEGHMQWPFKVVHNSPTEIIATYPSVGTTAGRRVINSRTIVIDKVSGDMIAANVDLWASTEENRPVTGRCGRKSLLTE